MISYCGYRGMLWNKSIRWNHEKGCITVLCGFRPGGSLFLHLGQYCRQHLRFWSLRYLFFMPRLPRWIQSIPLCRLQHSICQCHALLANKRLPPVDLVKFHPCHGKLRLSVLQNGIYCRQLNLRQDCLVDHSYRSAEECVTIISVLSSTTGHSSFSYMVIFCALLH